jgi:SAM-dependent methyltransferase
MTTAMAKEYWSTRTQYPFPFTKKRRIHELNYLLPRLERANGASLLDLACGDGSLLECLLRLTDYTELYGYDIAELLLRDIDPRVRTKVYDLANPAPLPKVDVTILAGAIQYLFDDEKVHAILSRITSPIVWIRSTCTLQQADEPVERDGYASLYRTVDHTLALIRSQFEVESVERVYPDNIESPFGTKQFYFEARRR